MMPMLAPGFILENCYDAHKDCCAQEGEPIVPKG